MGKRLDRLCEVRFIDETNGFGLDFVKKRERIIKASIYNPTLECLLTDLSSEHFNFGISCNQVS